jgi:hypothetical protein
MKEPERRTASPTAAWETLEEILITTIGPRWRRSAALPDAVPARGGGAETPQHLLSSILPNEELAAHLAARRTPTPAPRAEPPDEDVAVTVAPRDEQPAPPSRPRRARRGWLVAGCALAVVLVAAAVIALASGGKDDGRGGQPAPLARDVRALAAILDLSEKGNLLSKAKDFSGAVQNRTEVARRLAAFHPAQPLRAAAATLTQVTQLSIRFNRRRLAGQRAKAVDRQANALRHRFLAQFNPFAQRYLGRSYDIGQF